MTHLTHTHRGGSQLYVRDSCLLRLLHEIRSISTLQYVNIYLIIQANVHTLAQIYTMEQKILAVSHGTDNALLNKAQI